MYYPSERNQSWLKTSSETSYLLQTFLVRNASPSTTSTQLTTAEFLRSNKYPHNCFSSSSSVKSLFIVSFTSFHEHFLFNFYLVVHLLMHRTCYESLLQFKSSLFWSEVKRLICAYPIHVHQLLVSSFIFTSSSLDVFVVSH